MSIRSIIQSIIEALGHDKIEYMRGLSNPEKNSCKLSKTVYILENLRLSDANCHVLELTYCYKNWENIQHFIKEKSVTHSHCFINLTSGRQRIVTKLSLLILFRVVESQLSWGGQVLQSYSYTLDTPPPCKHYHVTYFPVFQILHPPARCCVLW